jgi:nucleotide-binding universal stress UspA family protein
MGEFVQLASQVEEEAREKAMAYLRRLAGQFGDGSRQWSCVVSVSSSLPHEIVGFALRESVDLIAMYTHDRKGLAKLVKGSVADKVQKKASSM